MLASNFIDLTIESSASNLAMRSSTPLSLFPVGNLGLYFENPAPTILRPH